MKLDTAICYSLTRLGEFYQNKDRNENIDILIKKFIYVFRYIDILKDFF